MMTSRMLAASLASLLLAAPAVTAQELSGYRGFQLGASVETVAQLGRIDAEPRILHRRPALIEELMWQPPAMRSPSPDGDSVKGILFTFYDGELFRMVVSYGPESTEGLTAQDMIASVSKMYGASLLVGTPIGRVPVANANGAMDSVAASATSTAWGFDATRLAQWADADHSVHLFRSPYRPMYGLVISSTRLDALAGAAAVEGARLDTLEAPQREADRLLQQADDKRVSDAKARQSNKGTFRP